MVSIHVLATPIRGRLRSASVNPMALYIERAPARARPSVIPRLICFRSMVRDYRTRNKVVNRCGRNEKREPVLEAPQDARRCPGESSCLPNHAKPEPTRELPSVLLPE